MTNNELMKMFEDHDKNRSRTTQKTEVTVRWNKSGMNANSETRFNAAIRFYQRSEKKITADGEYIRYTPDTEWKRIYFAEGDSIKGYKLSSVKSGYYKCATFAPKDGEEDMWKAAIGDYYLMYDRELECYYIDLGKKKK